MFLPEVPFLMFTKDFKLTYLASRQAMKKKLDFIQSVAMLALLSSQAFAQEIRVYTTVRNSAMILPNESPEKAPVVARSLTLFHAGKIYDYVDSAREVTVYEPLLRRFTLLSEYRSTKTELAQDELRQYLSLAEQEAWKQLKEVDKQTSPSQIQAMSRLKFQLQPEFEPVFDEQKSQLVLVGRDFQYRVDSMKPPSQNVCQIYLRFADAMAELNSALHPRAMLPAPRIKLNEELRQRQLLPLRVELRAEVDRPLWLQARHEWTWKFSSVDRQLISKWEKQIDDPNFRHVTFLQYQHDSLAGETARR